MSQAVLGFGGQLQRNGVSVAEVKNVSGPSLSRGSVDVTHHQSPDRWGEFIKGLKDGGEVTFDINYIPSDATHGAVTGLLSDFANDSTVDTWAIVFPDTANTTWSFPGFITAFGPSNPTDDAFTASVTLKVAGKPTLA
jgi:predicted secreted protein